MKTGFLIFMLLLTPIDLMACSCGDRTDRELYENAYSIFIGKVTSIYAPINGRYPKAPKYDNTALNDKKFVDLAPVRIIFQIVEVLKGKPENIESLKSGYGGGDCGYRTTVGEEYVFFTDKVGKISICSGAWRYNPKNPKVIKGIELLKSFTRNSTN